MAETGGLMLLLAAAATSLAPPLARPCAEAAGALPRPSLYCTELVPTPDLRTASGALELRPAPSPFGVAVTRDGHPRYRVVVAIAGLPAPAALGPFTAYVAWAATLSLDSLVRLGEVRNGRTELGELAYDQFRVLVTAEPCGRATRRSGRVVLRATSPSALLLAHRDLTQPSVLGLTSRRAPVGVRDASRWTMPPMPGTMAMAPWMEALRPAVGPFRPGVGRDVTSLPEVGPSVPVVLRSGDTLDLEAGLVRRTIAGRAVTMYAFNRQQPGPRIEVKQGATIVVRFRNQVDLPTALHWHGVRLDNRFDGTPPITQSLVQPGGGFVYHIHFRDAGVYWYHPHHREDVLQDLGLYGNIVVRSRDSAYYGPANREEPLTLDDVLVGADGPMPHGAEAPTHTLMGRFGNVFLVNGEPDYSLAVRRGEVVRFLLTNVSNARLYNLSFGGACMKLLASGVGKLEREAWVTSVVIGPAERYVVDVRFDRPGAVALANRVQALNHMFGNFFPEVDTLGLVRVSPRRVTPDLGAAFVRLRRNADVAAELAPYRRFFDRPVDHELSLELRVRDLPAAVMAMLAGVPVPVDWNDAMPMLNWVTTGREVTWVLRDPATGAENMDIHWRFTQGDVVKLRITNDPGALHAMAHPIHLHGQRFLVLSRNGARNEDLVWKDTAVIPAGESVDLLADMSNPGRWMLHCHIAEHLGAGMMTAFDVAPRGR